MNMELLHRERKLECVWELAITLGQLQLQLEGLGGAALLGQGFDGQLYHLSLTAKAVESAIGSYLDREEGK